MSEVVTIKKKELEELVEKAVEKALKERRDDDLITITQAAEEFNAPRNRIAQAVHYNRLGHVRKAHSFLVSRAATRWYVEGDYMEAWRVWNQLYPEHKFDGNE